ncbi:Gamma-aminobutyric acid receptor subunit alpha-4 [Homalodisca vitripennis]|nr:Gamma-aminobutyric acid receptor subunit alpha-4 [Homalodisca vitripennis]
MDRQSCPLILGSYAYPAHQLQYQWQSAVAVSFEPGMTLSQFDLMSSPQRNFTFRRREGVMCGGYPPCLASAVERRGTTTVNLDPAGVYSAWPQQSKNVEVRERLASAVKKCRGTGTVNFDPAGFYSAWPQQSKNVEVRERLAPAVKKFRGTGTVNFYQPFPLSLASAVKKCRGTGTVNLDPAGVYSAWPQQSKNVEVRERLASAVKNVEVRERSILIRPVSTQLGLSSQKM